MLENFTQVTPLLFTFSSLIIPIYTGNLKDLNLFVLLNISSVVNHVLKEFVFKPLMGEKTHPIIGRGARPPGARGTGIFKSNKISTSYGMPSGHVQTASVFSTYFILTRFHNLVKPYKEFVVGFLALITVLIAYGRVYLTKAHTVQQTIVGGLIGIALVHLYQSYVAF